MARKYKPKTKGYVIPYIYEGGCIRLILGVERLKAMGEYYCSLLGGTSKSRKSLETCTIRELAEETGGFIQMEPSRLIPFDSYIDKDRINIYLVPLKNTSSLIYDINKYREGLNLVNPECAENSFIVSVSLEELHGWDMNVRVSASSADYRPSSEAYHYFRKPHVNRRPLQSYKNFRRRMGKHSISPPSVWLSMRLIRVLTRLGDPVVHNLLYKWYKDKAHYYIRKDLGICDCHKAKKRKKESVAEN